ncbi:MAG: response regulator transcription factor [Flavobacteriales bacterium]|nr:MAG: response regulator transcription factor [Flavobacteriales bacterium]
MANTQEETPVAIVDDHYLVREGFVRMVDRMPGYRVAFTADDGVDYIAKCKVHGAPPLVLVDLSMPIMDGFQLVAWVREHQPGTRALVLSLYIEDDKVRRAMQAGACAYISKCGKPDEIREALDHVRLSGFHMNELVHQRMLVRPGAGKSGAQPEVPKLTGQELAVLSLMAGPEELTVDQIAERLHISRYTVADHRKEIYRKLDVGTAAMAVLKARELGLI